MEHTRDPIHPDETGIAAFASRWAEAARVRRSRRAFDSRPVGEDALSGLERALQQTGAHADARVVVVREPAVDVFTGALGTYGKISGAPHLLVVIADTRSHFHQQHAGYAGECAILEATAAGFDTCWVGGFFDPRKVSGLVELAAGERAVAVSPLGRAATDLTTTERAMRGMAGAHRRKPVEEIAPGIGPSWPGWTHSAAELVRVAPSAVNRQPWRLRFDGTALTVSRDNAFETPKVTKALDCGIAMLHAELGALEAGVAGAWSDLNEGLDVARFTPEAKDDR